MGDIVKLSTYRDIEASFRELLDIQRRILQGSAGQHDSRIR